MALEACNFEGLFLVRGRNDIDADVLIFALSKVVPSASVIAPKGRKRSLIKRFPTKLTESSSFVTLSRLSSIASIIEQTKTADVCVLDSLDLLIDTFGIDNVCKLIHKLKESRFVAASCQDSSVSEEHWKRLKAVADNYFTLCSMESGILAEGVVFKKNGKNTTIKETIEISSEAKLKSKKYKETFIPVETTELLPSAPFNMGLLLKDTERIAKEALQLPYMSSSNAEELVNLRSSDKKVRVGGQIIYTPDEADDLDDSDPDDDLNL